MSDIKLQRCMITVSTSVDVVKCTNSLTLLKPFALQNMFRDYQLVNKYPLDNKDDMNTLNSETFLNRKYKFFSVVTLNYTGAVMSFSIRYAC